MAAGITGKTAVADSLPDTFIAEVRLKVQEGPVMRSLVNNVMLPMGEGGQWEMTELSRATAIALSDGVDLASAEQITDSTLQITPTEFGAQVVVTDLARDQITKKTDLVRQVGRILGNSMVTKEDVDLLTQLDSFNTSLGGAGRSLTLGHILAGATAVRTGGQAAAAIVAGTQEPAPSPISAVFNDNMLHTVIKQMALGTITGYTATATRLFFKSADEGATEDSGTAAVSGDRTPVSDNRALREAFVGTVGRANVIADNNLGKDASDDAKGGVFSKEAIVQVHFRGGPKMEPERDASKRATEYNIVMVKGVGEFKDAWGREMQFDAASPTS
jgi:hypothetical protein